MDGDGEMIQMKWEREEKKGNERKNLYRLWLFGMLVELRRRIREPVDPRRAPSLDYTSLYTSFAIWHFAIIVAVDSIHFDFDFGSFFRRTVPLTAPHQASSPSPPQTAHTPSRAANPPHTPP